jgi:hypothetical protein
MMQRIIAGVPMHGLFATVAACSAPITTREQRGLIGAGLGAGTGAIIGSTVGSCRRGSFDRRTGRSDCRSVDR